MTTAVGERLRPAVHESVRRVEGRDAQSACIAAGRAPGELVRTTLGPKGLDKMLVGSDGKVVVTNDGASILDRMDVDHPVARLVVDVASQQDASAGDGTTTAVVLAGELLSEAERLLDLGLHPTSVTEGFHRAAVRAVETVHRDALTVDVDDPDRLREVARTVITGKWDAEGTAFLAERAVETVEAIRAGDRVDFDRITRKTATGGSVFDSTVVEGLVIDMDTSSTDVVSPDPHLPDRIEDAGVALVDGQLTVETVSRMETVGLDSPDRLEEFRRYEDDVYASQVAAIADSGADVVFCQQSIDDRARYLFADEGILAVERTRRDELHKLARATGAETVATTDELTPGHVGRAGAVERRAVGPTTVTVVSDEASEQVSLLIRGGTEHVVEETKRVLDDCFHVLRRVVRDGRVVPGGGATEVHLARDLREYASGIPRREGLAVEAFADALEVVPRTLATSAGLDPIDSLVALRSRHDAGETTAGLLLDAGEVGDVVGRGVLEPASVKSRAVAGAAEAANAILRVDDVIATAPDRADGEHEHDHDHDHGPGGVVESAEGYPWAIGH